MAADAAARENSYIGSLICLTSKSDIRYEGFMFHLDPNDSTIGLRNVKSFGTEGRRKDGPQVSASDKIYEYIFFKGGDIKVISSPSPQSISVVPDNPAIIQSNLLHVNILQSHFPHPSPTTMASTSHGAAKVANVNTSVQPILPVTPFQLNQLGDPSASSSSFWGSSLPPPPVNISGLAVANYWPGLVGSSGGDSHFQQHYFHAPPQSLVASHTPVQHQAKHQNGNTSVAGGSSSSEHHPTLKLRGSAGSQNTLPPLLPTPSVQSNPGQFAKLVSNLSSIPMPKNVSSALSSVPMGPGLKMASSLPGVLNENATPAPVNNEPSSVDPTSSHGVSSRIETTGVSFSKQSKLSPMIIEKQSGLSKSCPSQSLQTTDIDAKTAIAPVMKPLSSESTEETLEALLKSTTKTVCPLFVPSAPSLQIELLFTHIKVQETMRWEEEMGSNQMVFYTILAMLEVTFGDVEFTEDFDFDAMNEKFNKEEVWALLGKNKKVEADDGNEDDKEVDDNDVKGEAREVHLKDDSKPVYCKDDFFDSFSCDEFDQESAKVRLSEQKKKDAETFGVEIPIVQEDHGQGSRWAGASQVSYRGRGHGNERGSTSSRIQLLLILLIRKVNAAIGAWFRSSIKLITCWCRPLQQFSQHIGVDLLQTKTEIVVTEGDQDGGKIAAMVRDIGASALVVGLHDHSFLYKMAMAHNNIARNFNCKVLAIKQPTQLTTTRRRTSISLPNSSTNMDFSQIEITALSVPEIDPPRIPYQICPDPHAIIWRKGRSRRWTRRD
ncbi:hypothetical protein K7X08_024086 [Anisodus acutangulus]|uniref:DFDF domain-containing protein n=1 Tax=Anisodus acutangulus TaxID=402998 RepID=A0A9Q1M745_9SOLA|nr:hypothetical protein K7X08_024086 [Anisodus acutangulus]